MLPSHDERPLAPLRCKPLLTSWPQILALADDAEISKHRMLQEIVKILLETHQQQQVESRLGKATLPKMWSLHTFPFDRQPNLSESQVKELLDSETYFRQGHNILFIGPTGVGKSALATVFLMEAIKKGCTGKFIRFSDLVRELKQATELMNDRRKIRSYSLFDVLVIDEIGYIKTDPTQLSHVFEIIAAREGKCTMITSNLGFSDWKEFFHNHQLLAALIDRLTARAEYFDLSQCVSIRPERAQT